MPITLGIIFGNRDFFPDHLVSEARNDVLQLCEKFGIKAITLATEQSKLGGVETHAEARRCADLFKQHRDEIDGVLVVLPNFGDEKGVADTLKIANLKVPVLVQAYPDELDKLTPATRRDAFCGKISVCNNLVQAGIPFSLTAQHAIGPTTESFRQDLTRFVQVCRVVRGLSGVRLGAVGARPGAFNTVRYSEKILERNGISVTTVDLSEFLGIANRMSGDETEVKAKIEEIEAYANSAGVPRESMVQMAKLGIILSNWMKENALDATAIQCWTSMQQNFGCNVCTIMSMMSEGFMPSACEVDVTGVLTMYAMQLAGDSPSALVDWNNNYADDPDKCVLFHCGNWAKSFLHDIKIATAPILGTIVGEENTYGALDGRTPAGPLTYGRLTTDDANGRIRAYVGEGVLTDDALETFGNRAVAKVSDLQRLLQYVCKNGFEHHVVMNQSHTAAALTEAFENYLGWDVYHHGANR
ncbi:MAG: L-fucose/L-arabinose isomerase family protein [Pirellulaceae bacterium]|jgi:L-fucose isomerase-like protein|nr:L-fucose/L-arabinose isomerase family protein [Pirellulaceae bacterium]